MAKIKRCNWLIPAVLLLLLSLALAKPNSPPIQDDSESNESCGLNMECIPRRLCLDHIFDDSGFKLTSPRIGDTPCSKVLYRCCKISQKVSRKKKSILGEDPETNSGSSPLLSNSYRPS